MTPQPSEAVLLALALDGALTAAQVRQRLARWGVYDAPRNNGTTLLSILAQRGAVERVRRGLYRLGPGAPVWARLVAELGDGEKARWRRVLEGEW